MKASKRSAKGKKIVPEPTDLRYHRIIVGARATVNRMMREAMENASNYVRHKTIESKNAALGDINEHVKRVEEKMDAAVKEKAKQMARDAMRIAGESFVAECEAEQTKMKDFVLGLCASCKKDMIFAQRNANQELMEATKIEMDELKKIREEVLAHLRRSRLSEIVEPAKKTLAKVVADLSGVQESMADGADAKNPAVETAKSMIGQVRGAIADIIDGKAKEDILRRVTDEQELPSQ